MASSNYYAFAPTFMSLLLLYWWYTKINKYGFSQKNYWSLKKSNSFSHKTEMIKINRIIKWGIAIGTLAGFFLIYLVIETMILGWNSNIDMSSFKFNNGAIECNSNFFYDMNNARIGDPHFDYSFNLLGILNIVFLLVFLVLSNAYFVICWFVYNPEKWSQEFFYNLFQEKYSNNQTCKNIKTYRTIILITHIISNVSFLISIFVLLGNDKKSFEYWIVNFNDIAFDEEWGKSVNIYWHEIPTIIFSFIALGTVITQHIYILKLEDLTLTRYQASIIELYNQEHDVKIGKIK